MMPHHVPLFTPKGGGDVLLLVGWWWVFILQT
jgi:hypothetical protein